MTLAIETQATINLVKDDDWKYSINADIPLFGSREFKFITWNKKQGPPPTQGTDVLATLDPYRRSPYYINKGDLIEGDVDGTEPKHMLDYNMTACKPFKGDTVSVPTDNTSKAFKTPQNGGYKGITPTVDANERYRIDKQGWNDRSGLEFAILHGAGSDSNIYTEEELLRVADRFAGWLNERLLKRLNEGESDRLFDQLDSPLVEKAVEMGAEVVKVEKQEVSSAVGLVTTKDELSDYVKGMGWKSEHIKGILAKEGFASSGAYLATQGNTVQGLAELLYQGLEVDEPTPPQGELSW
mgnify:CR=1 FL=1